MVLGHSDLEDCLDLFYGFPRTEKLTLKWPWLLSLWSVQTCNGCFPTGSKQGGTSKFSCIWTSTTENLGLAAAFATVGMEGEGTGTNDIPVPYNLLEHL